MKYILELDESSCTHECGMDFYQCKQIPWWGVSDRIISKLPPYTEPDRKAIEDEVWEFVRICLTMDGSDFVKIFDSYSYINLLEYSYQDAKSKFEAWLKSEDEINVGDEIYSDGDYEKAVVMEIYGDGSVSVYTKSGHTEHWWNKMHNLKKTGRHFDEVAELLDKMRGEEE